VIGVGPSPSATCAKSICIWQVLPEKPAASQTEPRFSDEPAVLNPAASEIGDHLGTVAASDHLAATVRVQSCTDGFAALPTPANVPSIDLGIHNLQEMIRKHGRSLESASPERDHKKMRCNKRRSAKFAVPMAFLLLAAYAVHGSLGPKTPGAGRQSDLLPPGNPGRPDKPPLIPLLQWDKRSNGPACRGLKTCSPSTQVRP
jgi:hypothetical protein